MDTAQNFIDHLRQIHQTGPVEPKELFCGLLWAYYRSSVSDDPESPVKAKEILENNDLLQLMGDELGLFKYEQELVAKALQLSGHLIRKGEQDLERQGRRTALLRNEAFPLALQICHLDMSLSPEVINKWLDYYAEALPELAKYKDKKKRRRRKKPRRKKKTSTKSKA